MAKYTGVNNFNDDFSAGGSSGNDIFLPGTSADKVLGDIINGLAGVDRVIFDYSSDASGSGITSTGAGGLNGTFVSGSFKLTYFNIERFEITGTNFLDDIIGGAFDDILSGGAGDDFIQGLGGNDIIYGGDGYDKLNGGDGNDTIYGGAGNDFLNGGAGRDTLVGGLGNDVYFVDRVSDNIVELPGEGADRIKSSVSYSLAAYAANVETLELLEGSAATNGTGNSDNNKIFGNSNANRLDGGAGVDILKGFGGNDFLIGGTGNTRDLLYGGDGDDILEGGGGADRLEGGNGRDTFRYVSSADLYTDTIVDFNVADDVIQISRSGYGLSGLNNGVLNSKYFVLGSSTTRTGATVLYDSASGSVILDTNGSAAGGQIKLANVGSGLALTNSNFTMI